MVYSYICTECGLNQDHYVARADDRNNQVCEDCGSPLELQIDWHGTVDVWNMTHVPEVDSNIRFRNMKHLKEVARANDLTPDSNPRNPDFYDYHKKAQTRGKRKYVV